MASFSELANLSADMVAKVEDSKEARGGRQCDRNTVAIATPAGFFRVFDLGDNVGAEVGQLRETGHRRVAGETW